MKNPGPKLPAGQEFTPGQLDNDALSVRVVLDKIVEFNGSKVEVVDWILARWIPETQSSQSVNRANNVLRGMRNYGLLTSLDDPLELTEVAESIRTADSPVDEFAKHLITACFGLELLQFSIDVRRRDGIATNTTVLEELRQRQYQTSNGTTDHTKMRQWLQASGVVDYSQKAGWVVDDVKLQSLVGVNEEDIIVWNSLTDLQRAAISILRKRDLGNKTAIPVKNLLELLRQYGVEFNEKQVVRQLTTPLVDSGLIEHELDRAGGRGSKSGSVYLTDRGRALKVDLIHGLKLGVVPPELQVGLNRSTADILDDLDSSNTSVKGVALELLSLRMSADLGLIPADMRLRSAQTGGAEVDLVAEGAHLHFSRWLFQCKNQRSRVDLGVLAKELGMATLLRAQVVVIVTTSSFAKSVLEYSRRAAESTAIQVILIDGDALAEYKNGGVVSLRRRLHEFARDALSRKREQLSEVPIQ
jgi:hypothetical protein